MLFVEPLFYLLLHRIL